MKKTDKDEIVACSTELLRNKGLRGTSMADIAGATGLLKGSLYHHFPSKDAIVLEVLDRANHDFAAAATDSAYDDTQPAEARMDALMDYVTRYFQKHRTCLMAHMALEDTEHLPAARVTIRRFFAGWRNALRHILRARYDERRALSLAEDIIARIEGAAILYHVFDDPGSLDRACADAKALMRPR